MRGRVAAVVAAVLLMAACGSDAGSEFDEPVDPQPTVPVTQSDRPVPSVPLIDQPDPDPAELEGDGVSPIDPVKGEVPAALIDEILADAAERTGASVDGMTVVQAEATVWNDGSLGCPERGMTYTQALVNGFHVIVTALDQQLDYRTSGVDWFVLCEKPGFPIGNDR